MKRISVLFCLLLALTAFSGAAAEGTFFEEGFLPAAGQEEAFFEEMTFDGEAFFPADSAVPEDGAETEEEDAEGRSVLAIPGEEPESLSEDWQKAPYSVIATPLKMNTVLLTWRHDVGKLPKGVKYYVYEKNADGTASQVGTATKAELTLKNVPGGKHTYLVRAEYVDAKQERELHGLSALSNEVDVASELWKKAPALTAEQTGANEVTLSWAVDPGALYYEVTVTHGKVKEPAVQCTDGTYTDSKAVVGKNTYEVKAYGGKAAKKTVTLLDETWKTAPVVRKAVQVDDLAVEVGFWHVAPAASYEIAVGGSKQIVEFAWLGFDAETGCFTYPMILKKTGGKQKVTVQPLGTDEKGKTVKGTKSAAYTMMSLKDTLLGATNIRAKADGQKVIVTWENWNQNSAFVEMARVYLFNTETGAALPTQDVSSSYGEEGSATFSSVPNGTYKAFVRLVTEGLKDIGPALLYDTANLYMPVVVVDGTALADLEVTLDKTSATVYLETSPTVQLQASKTDTKRVVTWNSMNPMVATVDANGKVTGHGGGTAIITATAGNNVAVCEVTVNPVTYRALLIGNNYTWFNYLFGPGYDIDRMETMLKGLKKTPYQVTKRHNLASTGFADAISIAFKGADENDVSLFYYSGHGSGDEDTLGGLCGHSNTGSGIDGIVTPAELRGMLDTVNGRKVVIADSCFSGNLIGRSNGSENKTIISQDMSGEKHGTLGFNTEGVTDRSANSEAEANAAVQAFINAFQSDMTSRGGSNLAANQYYVITAASKQETSYDYRSKTTLKYSGLWFSDWDYDWDGYYLENGWTDLEYGKLYYIRALYYTYDGLCGDVYNVSPKTIYGTGAFTRSALRGLGWDMNKNFSKITATSMMADSNGDQRVSINELYHFVYDDLFEFNGYDSHEAQVWPDNCSEVFFAN